MSGDLPDPEEILEAHEEIDALYDLKFSGARTAAPELEFRQIISDAGEYDEVYFRAASLLRDLITAHVFEDANKRTSWMVTVGYLDRKGINPEIAEDDVVRVLRRIRRYEKDEIAAWLETGEIDESRLPKS
jgi:death-on-curing protein